MKHERIVIVGAGQAGGRAVEALRQHGFNGPITLIGEEEEPPYERPALSKSVLIGELPIASVYLHRQEYYRDNDIELLLRTRVEAIEAGRREVILSDGRSVRYSKLMLCTGSRARTLSGVASRLAGIHYLRTIKDCVALARDLLPGKRLVAIGGGFIGLELASSAVRCGLTVTIVEQKASLLDRVVPPEIAAHVLDLHRACGIDVRLSCPVASVSGSSRVESVELSDGLTLPADIVAIGIGVVPNSEIAKAAGAACGDGLLVDEYGETSLPGVYAAGDVTNHPNSILGKPLRLESWQNAQNQAIAVAKNMLGARTPYCEVPWFWSDQLGHNIQMLGISQTGAQLVWRGERDSGRCMAFTLEADRITSAIAFNDARELRFARRLIEVGAEVTPEVLRDTSSALKHIAAAAEPRPQNSQSYGGTRP